MGTSLIGSFSLENGETVWAVYHEVDMPDFSPIGGKGTGRFYKGSSKKDLETGNPRLLVFGTMPDGSRVMYDCAVQVQANKALHLTASSARSYLAPASGSR